MNLRELTLSVLKIQAHSKLLLVYLEEKNEAFAIASVKLMEEELKKIRDNCVSRDNVKFYLTSD